MTRMNDYILFKDIDGKYTDPSGASRSRGRRRKTRKLPTKTHRKIRKPTENDGTSKEADDGDQKDVEPEDTRKPIYYVTDKNQQSQYINMFRKQADMNAVILDHNIDSSFITQLEQRNQNYKFLRIDADVTDSPEGRSIRGRAERMPPDTLTEHFPQGPGQGQAGRKSGKIKRQGYLLHDHALRGEPQNAGYDEDVQYVRHGSIHVRW